MSVDTNREIDWTHEREWRWVDHKDVLDCPGLPIWLDEELSPFSEVFIVVPNQTEVDLILDWLKILSDLGYNDFDQQFRRDTLASTSVIALDHLADETSHVDMRHLRLDDIPRSYTHSYDSPEITSKFVENVRRVYLQAQEAGDRAAAATLRTAKRTTEMASMSQMWPDGPSCACMIPSLNS